MSTEVLLDVPEDPEQKIFDFSRTRTATLNLNRFGSNPNDLERLNANQAECVQPAVMSRFRATSTLIR